VFYRAREPRLKNKETPLALRDARAMALLEFIHRLPLAHGDAQQPRLHLIASLLDARDRALNTHFSHHEMRPRAL
jgi:hypothetical protein